MRDVAKASRLAERGVRVRYGTYEDPAALLDSFEGAEQVLLLSSNDPHAGQANLHRTVIDAKRILYASHQHIGAHGSVT